MSGAYWYLYARETDEQPGDTPVGAGAGNGRLEREPVTADRS